MKKIIILSIIMSFCTFQSCVQKVHIKEITFKVDMNHVSTAENVGIKGNFTNPSWEKIILLTDENNDGIYEGTFREKTAASNIQFKFVNQNHYELKDQPNRTLPFEFKPEILTYEATFNVAK